MIVCDLCGETKDCLRKEIEGKQYDICAECWNPLEQKLKGKGRTKYRETVFLPGPRRAKEEESLEPPPGELPKIWGGLVQAFDTITNICANTSTASYDRVGLWSKA